MTAGGKLPQPLGASQRALLQRSQLLSCAALLDLPDTDVNTIPLTQQMLAGNTCGSAQQHIPHKARPEAV